MPVISNGPRGYSVVALDNPKSIHNVGGVLRAAACFGAGMVVVSGIRYRRASTDTLAAHRHLPLIELDPTKDIMGLIPHDCVPVAVDLVDDACPLPEYRHPERAFYVFGAEDATLGYRVTSRCRDKIYIPMSVGCLNLAMAVNVVLYDRMCKAAVKLRPGAENLGGRPKFDNRRAPGGNLPGRADNPPTE